MCTYHRPIVKRYGRQKKNPALKACFFTAPESGFVKFCSETLVNQGVCKKKLHTHFDTHCIKMGVQLWCRRWDSNLQYAVACISRANCLFRMISPEKRQNSLLPIGPGREGALMSMLQKREWYACAATKSFPYFFPYWLNFRWFYWGTDNTWESRKPLQIKGFRTEWDYLTHRQMLFESFTRLKP